MTTKKVLVAVVLFLCAALANAQWMASYEKGLKAARGSDWVGARAAFLEAVAYRPEDASGPTTLPGPVSDRKMWRNGASYSPNFLAAYSEYRIGLSASKPEDAKPALDTAAAEFEALLSKNQVSRETYFFLNQIYTRTGDTAKRLDLETRSAAAKPNFRVDTEVIAPEELSVLGATTRGTAGTGPEVTVIKPGGVVTPTPAPGIVTSPGVVAPAVGPVSPVATKFALVIGNSTSSLKQGAVTYGADDAQAVREALVTHAGYAEANVDLVLNATRDQLLASAKALADRVSEEGTVFIYFAGNGANIGGKDYLAGVDTSSETDASSMAAKLDVYSLFMAKGAKIFAFFQVPRPIVNGAYFGKEIPLVGSISQLQSTIPGDGIASRTKGGRQIGIFTEAVVTALQEIRSNRIPIMEFGWQVFNRIRGGGAGMSGGGARQVPTLPVLTHMSDQERF